MDAIEDSSKFQVFTTYAGEQIYIWDQGSSDFFRPEAGVHIINLDGSGMMALTDRAISSFGAACSPDGKYILFSAKDGEGTNIFQINQDGSNLTALTSGEEDDLAPGW
jgi:Tol biopolymer transport system component